MPEIDNDTFQVLALLLLVAAVALAALALITVTRLRDELLDRDGLSEPENPTVSGYQSAYPATQTETFPPTSTPLGGTGEASSSWAGGGDTDITSTPGSAAMSGASSARTQPSVATAYEPVPTSSFEPTTGGYEPATSFGAGTEQAPAEQEPAPAGATGAASTEPMPEEQPFEREGRWWYKRGDELLVYDEGSGQWEPAPQGSLGSAAGSVSSTQQSAAPGYASVGPAAAEASPTGSAGGAVHDDPGGFWKCTSCGAINGSTAGSCRMCFAAHP